MIHPVARRYRVECDCGVVFVTDDPYEDTCPQCERMWQEWK